MKRCTETELRIAGHGYIADLAKLGLDVVQFTEYHFRIGAYFDVFPNHRGGNWKWKEVDGPANGWIRPSQLSGFVPDFVRECESRKPKLPPATPAPPQPPRVEGKPFMLTIEVDENDIREVIAKIPKFFYDTDALPIARLVLAVKAAYEKARQ
jgi:hypothetical protein